MTEQINNQKMDFKIFDLYDLSEVKVEDPGLKATINLDPKLALKSQGRNTWKMGQLKVNIVERLINRLAVAGHRGKKHKLEKISRIRTRHCFVYNNIITFAVPEHLVSKAIGSNGSNVKKLSQILNKKIKIIAAPESADDAEKFIRDIVAPATFKDAQVLGDEIVVSGSRQSKAALIGRDKVRLLELQRIIRNFFGKELKIG